MCEQKRDSHNYGCPKGMSSIDYLIFYYRSRCKDIFRCFFLKIPQPLNGLTFTVQHNVNHERNIPVLVIPLERLAVIAVLMDGDGKQTVIDELLIQNHPTCTPVAIGEGMDPLEMQVGANDQLDDLGKGFGGKIDLFHVGLHECRHLFGRGREVDRLKLCADTQWNGAV